MFEYRLKSLATPLKKALKEKGLDIVEEKFKNRKSWLVYSSKNLDKLLKGHDTDFEKQRVEDTGWEDRWKEFLKDGWLTDTVYYCFDDKVFDDNRLSIRINPALAFGTGNHATTQIAACLLDTVAKGQNVLDIGTGSGILAILASIKGAKSVYACDVDGVAIGNAKENIRLNNCDNIHLWTGEVTSVSTTLKPSVVVANIITSVLIPLHPYILKLHPKYIIYSGITQKEGSGFMASISMQGYQPDAILHKDKWSGIRLKRINP